MNESLEKSKSPWRVMLIAVAVVVVLMLIAPAFQSPRGRNSMMFGNLNNLYLFGIAITNFATANDNSLPRNHSLHSWRVVLCPAMDRSDLYRAWHFDAAWDAPENHLVTGQWLYAMTSPYRPIPRQDIQGRGYTDYGLISGPGTVNPPDGPVTLDSISDHDGLSTTLLVGECSGLQIVWTEPRDPDVSRQTVEIGVVTSSQPNSNCLLSTYSSRGVCVLFADGSAKSLNTQMHPVALKAICTVAGGEDLTGKTCD